MKVKFVGSFFGNFPKNGKRHVVFVGRSNVGKSSLINMLLGRQVARVSKEPGRTRAVNFIHLEDYDVYFVDLPGYGFAKTSKTQREKWKELVEEYFMSCWKDIKIVFLLIDCVAGPTELDLKALEWLESLKLPYLIVLTKCDRATQKDISKTIKTIKGISSSEVIITSAKEGRGKKEVLRYAIS